MVFARKPDGSWCICYDYRGLNAITRPAVEPPPHIDALLDGTRGSRLFTKLDLASSYHLLRVRAADRWKTSFRSQLARLGQFEWNVVPFGLQGASSLLMRVMNQALTVDLYFPGHGAAGPAHAAPQRGLPPIHRGVPGASGPLGRFAFVYMDDCLVHSPKLEQHLRGARDLPPAAALRQELQARVRATRALLPRPPTLCRARLGEPAQGAVHRRVGDADVVL